MGSVVSEKREILLPRSGAVLALPTRTYEVRDSHFDIVPDEDRLDRVVEMVNGVNSAEGVRPLTEINFEYHDGFSHKLSDVKNPRRAYYSRRDNYQRLFIAIGTTIQSGDYTLEQLVTINQSKINDQIKAGFADLAVQGFYRSSARNRLLLGILTGSTTSVGIGTAVGYEFSPFAGILTAVTGGVATFVGSVASGTYSESGRCKKIRDKIVDQPNLGIGNRYHEDFFTVPLLSLARVT